MLQHNLPTHNCGWTINKNVFQDFNPMMPLRVKKTTKPVTDPVSFISTVNLLSALASMQSIARFLFGKILTWYWFVIVLVFVDSENTQHTFGAHATFSGCHYLHTLNLLMRQEGEPLRHRDT